MIKPQKEQPGTGFFREHRAIHDPTLNNYTGHRWRVNDAQMSVDPKYGDRPEAHANGLMTLSLPENLPMLRAARLYLELWGGHPHTANKRFTLNGKGGYSLPEAGAAAGHCVYTYPSVPLDLSDLVSGTNAIQFSCDRGDSFWGHYIIDNAALRCVLNPEHPDIQSSGLSSFNPHIHHRQHDEQLELSLELADSILPDIERVDFFGRYYGFDDTGVNGEGGWHGFTQGLEYKNHLGTARVAPYNIHWDIGELDGRNRTVSVLAVVRFSNGLNYQTGVSEIAVKPVAGKRVELMCCDDLPVPFWSRAGQKKVASFHIGEISGLKRVTLWVKIWDGGEGGVQDPFTLNGHPYSVTSGEAVHDVVFSRLEVDPAHIVEGKNEFVLLSDTEHHGVEVLLPGPCLTLTFSDSAE